MMKIRWISFIIFLSIALVGCEALQTKEKNSSNPNHSGTNEIESLSTPLPTMRAQEDDMPKDPPLPIPRDPGLSALTEAARVDLSQRLSVPTSQIKVIETKETSWPDTSLGCPQSGIVYAQIPTPGYRVILEYAGKKFEYHVGIHGNVLYC